MYNFEIDLSLRPFGRRFSQAKDDVGRVAEVASVAVGKRGSAERCEVLGKEGRTGVDCMAATEERGGHDISKQIESAGTVGAG